MPAKLELPEKEIVQRYLNGNRVTQSSLAEEYGCHRSTISKILNEHISAGEIETKRRVNLSDKAKEQVQKENLSPEEWSRRMAYVSSHVDEETRSANQRAAAKAAGVYWRGRSRPKETREKMSGPRPHTRGENSGNWKGGVSDYQWRKPNWREQRRKCRKRDKNECQSCGITAEDAGKNMDVHHIVSYHKYDNPREANKLNNLICLCRSCHRKVENGTLKCPAP